MNVDTNYLHNAMSQRKSAEVFKFGCEIVFRNSQKTVESQNCIHIYIS